MLSDTSTPAVDPDPMDAQRPRSLIVRIGAVIFAALLIWLLASFFSYAGFYLGVTLGVLCLGYAFRCGQWVAAGLTGAAVLLIAFLAVWGWSGNSASMRWDEERWLRMDSRKIVKTIEAYKTEHGKYPEIFFDVELPPEDDVRIKKGDQGELLVGYYQAAVLRYEKQGDGYRLTWLGDDKLPGGTGLNKDLEYDQTLNGFPIAQVPFWQFFRHGRSQASFAVGFFPILLFLIFILLDPQLKWHEELKNSKQSKWGEWFDTVEVTVKNKESAQDRLWIWIAEVIFLMVFAGVIGIVLAAFLIYGSQSGH